MRNYKIAWRNLWRNKRRTLITVASVFFAVFFALLMRSLQLGSYDHMFRNVIESYTGYIQVQNEDFKDNSTVDNAFELTPRIRQILLREKNVSDVIPRFESFALASSGALTKGVLVMGIDPEKETRLSNIKGRLVSYKLSAKAIDSLKRSGLSEKIILKLNLFKEEGYSSESILQMDLGMLTAIGMNKKRVFSMIMLESVFLSLIGAVTGMITSYILIRITGNTGINLSQYAEGFEALGYSARVYPQISAGFFGIVTILIILTGILSSIYPATKALKLNPVEAIRVE